MLPPLTQKHKFSLYQDTQRIVKMHNYLPFWNAEFVGNIQKMF